MFSSIVSSAAGSASSIGGLGGMSSLMNSETVTFDALKDVYGGFAFPQVRVEVGDKEIKAKDPSKAMINNLTIELTSDYDASMAHFRLYNIFDVERRIFLFTDVDKFIQIGKKVNISLGYSDKLEMIFSGFIAGVNYVYERGDAPFIELTCMDIKGLMMSNVYSKQLKGKSYSACVNELLSKSAYSKFGATPSITSTPQEQRDIEMVDESDYEFIVKAAKKFAYEFFVSQGTVYFRAAKSVKKPVMKLSFNEGLLYMDMGYSLTGMVKKIETRSTDSGKGKLISAKAQLKGRYADSSSASSLLTDTQKIYIDPTLSTQQEAQKRAKALMEQISYRFGSLNAECIGIPNLIPGRFVQFTQMGKNISNKFYITAARHSFSTELGYTTVLTAKADSL